jgi:hypothetical protein
MVDAVEGNATFEFAELELTGLVQAHLPTVVFEHVHRQRGGAGVARAAHSAVGLKETVQHSPGDPGVVFLVFVKATVPHATTRKTQVIDSLRRSAVRTAPVLFGHCESTIDSKTIVAAAIERAQVARP